MTPTNPGAVARLREWAREDEPEFEFVDVSDVRTALDLLAEATTVLEPFRDGRAVTPYDRAIAAELYAKLKDAGCE